MGSFTYEFDSFTTIVQGAYSESNYDTRQDYWMDVGATVGTSIYTGLDTYPIADALSTGGLSDPGPCNVNDGNAGVYGAPREDGIRPCVLYDDLTHQYSFDKATDEQEYWTVEGRIQSAFEGRFNFVLGASAFDTEGYGDYYVNGNMGDARADTYPGFFNNYGPSSGGYFLDGWAGFGEVYFDVTDRLKLTLGARYNDDNKELTSTTVLWDAHDINWIGCLIGAPADQCSYETLGGTADSYYTRVPTYLALAPGDIRLEDQVALVELYNTPEDVAAAEGTDPRSPERFANAANVPIVAPFDEARVLSNSPNEFDWQEWSGRVLLNFQVNDNVMLYGGYTKGYKPGGANPAIPTRFQADSNFDFDQEDVDAFEIGAKTTLLDGRMVVNGALFFYDYEGLQVERIKNNTALNENIEFDLAYSYLDTDVQNTESTDPLAREGGDPDWLTFNTVGFLYAARREQITPEVLAQLTPLVNVFPAPNTFYNEVVGGEIRPGSEADGVPLNTPIIINRGALEALGVDTVEGIPTDISGNNLPNAPENTIKLGAAYTWNLDAIRGALTFRWDYYWQDDSYAREFNTSADEIDSWDQHNAQIIYESANGRWVARAFVRNIGDEDNVTGHYVTSDTSGYYRNYFLTEPRIYGASVRYSFGGG
jgi:outer membrane receptor protein involved in Fe transport